MIRNLRVTILFIVTLFSTAGFSQEWYEMINEDPVNIEAVKNSAEKYFDEIGRGKHTGYKQYQRWLNNAMRNIDKDGVPYTSEHVIKEIEKFKANKSKKQQRGTAYGDADAYWTPMGPYYDQGNIDGKELGRLPVMEIEPVNQQLLFVGSDGGGLWRSQDAGESWVPLIDDTDNMFVIAIAIDPHNTSHVLYLNDNSELYESLDQGDTWQLVKNFNQNLRNYSKMMVFHPTIEGVYYVAGRALLKTTDGGANFSTVLDENNDDIFFKPGDPSIMYSVGTDFWKSTDSGDNWTKITNGISLSQRMKMTVTPANPSIVYIIQSDEGGSSFGRIYKSTDSGNSFQTMANTDNGATNYLGSQAWRCMTIMCSATNSEELHMGGLRNFRSDDGGATLYEKSNSQGSSSVAFFHEDVLVMSSINGNLYVSSDGGIYRSVDGGENYVALTGGLGTTQFYRMGSTSPYPGTGVGLDPDMVIGGAQDNGTHLSKGVDHAWQRGIGSDGMEAFIDYTNEDNLFGSKQSGILMYSTDGGENFYVLNRPESSGRWTTPFEMDPVTPTTLYCGYSELHMSTNSGEDWEALTSGQTGGENIHEIAIAPSDNNYIYFAESDRLWVSKNAQSTNRTWTEVSGIEENINYITVDPNDPSHALIANAGSEVYETKDAGTTWTEISGNLPNVATECVLIDSSADNTIYVGMTQGVYYKDDTMTDWEIFGIGLPKCQVRELEINYQASKLRVATYGRGIWEIPIFGTNTSVVPRIALEAENEKCYGDSIQLTVQENQNWLAPISYQWYKNEVLIPEATGVNYYALEDGSYSVEVTANEVSGKSTETEISFLETPAIPSVSNEIICDARTVTLEASGSGEGALKWYSDEEGANELAEGNTFSVDVTETSTYYVKETSSAVISKTGMEDQGNFEGEFYDGGAYLIMDVESAFTLLSVKVYTEEASDRTFDLRDANDDILLSKTIYVTAGESRVDLDFDVPVGNDLRIGTEDGVRLYRSKGEIAYPFVVEGIVSITTSINGSGLYYFLYDWEIQSGSASLCSSPSASVTITLDNCVGLSTYENENLTLFPNPTSGLVHLKLPEGFKLKKIEVSNIQGNILLSYNKYREQIDLQDFKAGTYLVKVSGEQGAKVFKVEVH